MATYTLSSTLVNNPSYAQIGSQNLAPGDTIVNRIYYTSGTGVSIVSETGGSPALGVNQATNSSGYATFSYTTTTADANSSLYFYFWGANGNPYWNNITNFRGKVLVNVSAGNVCSVASSGNLAVAYATTTAATTTATLSGITAGTNCTLQTRATAAGTTAGSFSNTTTHTVTRGVTYYFEASNTTFPVTKQALTSTVPYLATDLAVGVGTANVVGANDTGAWTQTVTGIAAGGWYNYRVYTSVSPIRALSEENFPFLNTRVGDVTIVNDKDSNTPGVGETVTYNLWGARTRTSGGSGIFDITNPVASFTVTRAVGHSEVINDASGSYYDNDTGTSGASHSVYISQLTNSWEYAIGDVSANINSPLLDWQAHTVEVKVVPDSSPPADTAKTYYIWRRDSSGNNVAQVGTYTRILRNYNRFSFQLDEVPLSGTDTEFTQTIANGIAGHFYYIYNGNNLRGWASPQSDGTFTINVTESALPNTGNTATHTLYSLSAQNSSRTQHYNTAKTYTVIRTGSGETEEGADSSAYGLEVFNSDESAKLYDTTSRVGRIMKSGRIPSGSGTVAVGGNSGPISVPGLENTTDYQVIYLPEDGGVAATGSGYRATVAKSTNSFTITNFGTVATAWKYYVIKSGG
mgnify:CR=1 FL=1